MEGPEGLPAIQLSVCHKFFKVFGHGGLKLKVGSLQHSGVATHEQGNGYVLIDSRLSHGRVHQLIRPGKFPIGHRVSCMDLAWLQQVVLYLRGSLGSASELDLPSDMVIMSMRSHHIHLLTHSLTPI